MGALKQVCSNCRPKVYSSATQLSRCRRPAGMVWPCPCSPTLQNRVAASKLPFGNGLWQAPAPRLCLGSIWKVHRGQNSGRTTRTIRKAALAMFISIDITTGCIPVSPSRHPEVHIRSTMSASLRGGCLQTPSLQQKAPQPSKEASGSSLRKTSWLDWDYARGTGQVMER